MEQNSRKNDDCYFYYYSTCLKGDNCLFRHEENALGCEVVCQYWKEGKCLNERCNFRHMELKKNRKVIPCYWETQPGGCRKPHCPFRHLNQKEKPPDKSKEGNVSGSNMVMPGGVLNVQGNTAGRNPNSDGGVPGPTTVLRGDLNYAANPVDPIVVKFEEESDNESVPSSSPLKVTLSPSSARQTPMSPLRVKTLEEIRLERIQKQSAAYYNMDEDSLEYPSRKVTVISEDTSFDNRKRRNAYTDCKVLTLDEIRKNRQKRLASSAFCDYSGEEFDTNIDCNGGLDSRDRADEDFFNKVREKKLKINILPDSTSEGLSSDEVSIGSKHTFNVIENIKGSNASKSESHLRPCYEENYSETNNGAPMNVNLVESKDDCYNNCVKVPLHQQKPVKLRRFIKRTIDDVDNSSTNHNRRKLKRCKLNEEKDIVCSGPMTNSVRCSADNIDNVNINDCNERFQIDDNVDFLLTSSPITNDDESNDIDTIDIIKDIDDLLND